jgi:AraC-like DNA-binding protein
MNSDQQKITALEEPTSHSALNSYLAALEYLAPGAIVCSKKEYSLDAVRSTLDLSSVLVPVRRERVCILVRVDEELAKESGLPPAFWRKPVVFRMLEAMHDNLCGRAPIQKWPDAVKSAWALITQHPCQSMSLGEVAGVLKLSPGYLGERLEKILGSTFRSLLRDERVAVAAHQLLTTNLRISEISDQLGGQSLSQFNRNFFSAMGMSPRTYRNRYSARRRLTERRYE